MVCRTTALFAPPRELEGPGSPPLRRITGACDLGAMLYRGINASSSNHSSTSTSLRISFLCVCYQQHKRRDILNIHPNAKKSVRTCWQRKKPVQPLSAMFEKSVGKFTSGSTTTFSAQGTVLVVCDIVQIDSSAFSLRLTRLWKVARLKYLNLLHSAHCMHMLFLVPPVKRPFS
jgi:hypothetical protein